MRSKLTPGDVYVSKGCEVYTISSAVIIIDIEYNPDGSQNIIFADTGGENFGKGHQGKNEGLLDRLVHPQTEKEFLDTHRLATSAEIGLLVQGTQRRISVLSEQERFFRSYRQRKSQQQPQQSQEQ